MLGGPKLLLHRDSAAQGACSPLSPDQQPQTILNLQLGSHAAVLPLGVHHAPGAVPTAPFKRLLSLHHTVGNSCPAKWGALKPSPGTD